MIVSLISLFSVSLSVLGNLAPSYAYDLMLICPLKPFFVSPRPHWCVDHCHSLLLKGRVCNRWSFRSRPTVAASAGCFSWQCCWLWNEEDTLRLVKRLLLFFFLDWHQLGEASITQRKSELPVSSLNYYFVSEVYTSRRRSDSPLPPFHH